MRGAADLDRLSGVLKEPIRTFVRESRVRIALLVNGSGQVLAQHGFTKSYEVVNVASLAAAAHASAHALAEVTGSTRWTHLHHAGESRQLLLAPFRTGAEDLILVAIFDSDSSLGLVQLFCDQLAEEIRALPEFKGVRQMTDMNRFERDLEAGIDNLFASDSGES